VVIFGSRAKGNFTEGSDIDLAIKGSAVTFDTVLNLMDKADSLGLLYKIDIQDYRAITDKDVLEHIQRVGKVFWRRDVKVKV
jgi:predicted nucleotidyltransferase